MIASIEFLFGVLLWLSLNACGGAPPTTDAAAPLEDDFSAPECLFGSLEGTTSRGYGCVDGEFRGWIDNDQEAYDFVSASAGELYGDVSIEVDVRFVSGDDAGAYLFCRGGEHTGDFYAFRVGVDGSVEISDYLGGEEQIARLFDLEEGVLVPGTNRLRADCIGNGLALYVNGNLALEREIEGDAYGPDGIGLGAGGGSQGLSEVRFDNLVVTGR